MFEYGPRTMIGQLSTRGRAAVLLLLLAFSLFGLFDHSLWSANDTREGAMIDEETSLLSSPCAVRLSK